MKEEGILKYMQNSIISNTDNYNPRQLTCFHKPWAILYASICKEYFDLYLMFAVFYENFGYNNYFKWFDFIGNLNENYYKFAKEVLEPRFGIEVNKEYYTEYDEFIRKTTTLLRCNEKVLVPADLIYIPYYEDYKINNHIHFFIIKGFDMEKKIFYILDNMHIDNGSEGIYKNFVITFERMFKCAAKSRDSYFSNEKSPFFWKIKNKDCKKYTIEGALIDHMNELKNIELIRFPEEVLWENIEKGDALFARNYAKVINYREVYYDIVIKLLRKLCVDDMLGVITELHDINYSKWESLRTKVLYYYRKKKLDDKLKYIYNVCKEENCILFKKISNIMEGFENNTLYKNNSFYKNNINFFYKMNIYNPNNAIITYKEDSVIIEHKKTEVYDTWKNQNNAPQLLFNIKGEDKVEFETNLKINNNIDFPFFSGLIAYAKDDKLLLFGNDALCSMALYCPQYEKNFTVKKSDYFSDFMKLKVIVINKEATFSYYDNNMNRWVIWESPNELEINKLGLVSKTWNAIEHKSEFSNIKVRVNDEHTDFWNIKIEKE